MSNIRIADLPEITLASNDNILIINDSLGTTSKITWQDLQGSIGTLNRSIVLPLGSASIPAIAFGDTTSGVYSPTLGDIALVAGSLTRIAINAYGHIGIGKFPIDLSNNAIIQIKESENSDENNIDMGNNKIVRLKGPESNSDAATKYYVDTSISGANFTIVLYELPTLP